MTRDQNIASANAQPKICVERGSEGEKRTGRWIRGNDVLSTTTLTGCNKQHIQLTQRHSQQNDTVPFCGTEGHTRHGCQHSWNSHPAWWTVGIKLYVDSCAFSALRLLAGWQEGHPACKNWVVRYWHGYLSGSRWKWFAYGPADATGTPIISCSSKIQNSLPFCCQFTQVVLEKRLLNGCSSSSSWRLN